MVYLIVICIQVQFKVMVIQNVPFIMSQSAAALLNTKPAPAGYFVTAPVLIDTMEVTTIIAPYVANVGTNGAGTSTTEFT